MITSLQPILLFCPAYLMSTSYLNQTRLWYLLRIWVWA